LKEKTKKLTPAEQHARFVEAAYKVEADQATDALDKAFKRLNPSLKPPRATKGGRKDG
jgi:hypothetical protein